MWGEMHQKHVGKPVCVVNANNIKNEYALMCNENIGRMKKNEWLVIGITLLYSASVAYILDVLP